jgi:hypothetical protein
MISTLPSFFANESNTGDFSSETSIHLEGVAKFESE